MKNKNFKIDNLIKNLSQFKENNFIIGFTNGCFDLLHKGHLYLLLESKKRCDYLIVGLNSDCSIKSLKGESRPIDNESRRIAKLSEIDEVDAIIVFNEITPLELVKKIKPDILFKGADYINKDIVGKEFILDNGGKIYLIDILAGYSTTNIINNSSN